MFQNDTSAKAQEMSDFQKAMGANMYEAYIDYFNALGLTVDGVSYELSEDGRSGSFYDFLLEQYGASYSVYAAKNNLRLDGNVLAIDDSNAGFVALSRANGFANAQQAIGKPAQGYAVVTESDAIYKQLSGSFSAGTYSGETLSNLKTEQSKKYSLSDLYTTDADGSKLYEYDFDNDIKTVTGAVDFDNPRWETLLAQMSVDEMQMLIGRGGWQTAKVESIDKEKGVDYDGPSGLSNLMQNMMGVQTKCTSFQSEPVSASTWNVELIERLGKAVGKEANASGQAGWYAPGANIHRSPFGGRNAEYFSEDAYLSGVMCAAESKGALSVGLYCVGKHFAFNDIEARGERKVKAKRSVKAKRIRCRVFVFIETS